MGMGQASRLAGMHLLLVEDEFFLARALAGLATAGGAVVVGPAGSIEDALWLIDGTERIDAAVLDLNLRGEMAFPVADALLARQVRFAFATGYDGSAIPARYRMIPRCEKPIDMDKLVAALLG